jgi:hypothetical protein
VDGKISLILSLVYHRLKREFFMVTFQHLTDEYIQKSKRLTISERLEFLEEYRLLLPETVFIEKYKQYMKDWESVDGF